MPVPPILADGTSLDAAYLNAVAAGAVAIVATVAERDSSVIGDLLTPGRAVRVTSDTAANNGDWLYWGGSWVHMWMPRTSFTPALSGITIGNGDVSAAYSINGGIVTVDLQITLGSTSSITADMIFDTPVPAAITNVFVSGNGRVTHGTTFADLFCLVGNGHIYVRFRQVSGGIVTQNRFDASTPLAWATGDIISARATYPLI